MFLTTLILVGWVGHFIVCYYLVRLIPYIWVRIFLTLVPCILLTYIGCHGLPLLRISSMFIIAIHWMASIRLIHLIAFSPNMCPTFRSFLATSLWIFFQIVPRESTEKQWPIVFDFVLAGVKLILNHWIHRWLLICPPSDSSTRIIMFYAAILVGSHVIDVQIGLVRIATRDKYTLQSFTNFPVLSRSLREFWGQRYNRLTSAIFRESIFEPVSSYLSSRTMATLITFIISGLLHVHAAFVLFDDVSSLMPTFMFFPSARYRLLCRKTSGKSATRTCRMVFTHIFLLSTAPLFVGIFTRRGNTFFVSNAPLLIDVQWIPKLPVPTFCPK